MVQQISSACWPQVEARLRVTDLHSVTPSSFLELSGGTVHALSYQQVGRKATTAVWKATVSSWHSKASSATDCCGVSDNLAVYSLTNMLLQARNNRAVVGQVYVAEPGYMLVGGCRGEGGAHCSWS
jgi:hypothetical protein